jgi:predicted amidohydrolase YtcJ
MNADLILYNTKTIASGPEYPSADIVAIKGNEILFTGSKDEMSTVKGPNTRLIDCEGGTIIPGFNDAHCHPLAYAATLRYIDCSPKQVTQIADIQFLLRRKAEETAADQWIRATNYDASLLAEKRPPNRWELDKSTPDNPLILVEYTGQQCVLNSKALQICGITESTPDTTTGKIHRAPDTGEPNGIISGHNEAVAKSIPPISDGELEIGMTQANKHYLTQGITSVQDTSWTNSLHHWLRMKDYKDNGLLSPRVNFLPGVDSLKQFQDEGLKSGDGDSQMRIGGIKIALDESTNNPHPPQEEISDAAIRAHQAGFQLAFHVSDIHMLRASINALMLIKQSFSNMDNRPRFEHCPICPADLFAEISAGGVQIISQPSLLYTTGPDYLDTVKDEQLGWIYPFNSLLQHNIRIAFSSDCPLAECNPLQDIGTAITRKVRDGRTLNQDEHILLVDAFRMYAYEGAYASFEETIKGSISVGKLADLVVLDGDVTQIPPEQISELQVRTTLINGRICWES